MPDIKETLNIHFLCTGSIPVHIKITCNDVDTMIIKQIVVHFFYLLF